MNRVTAVGFSAGASQVLFQMTVSMDSCRRIVCLADVSVLAICGSSGAAIQSSLRHVTRICTWYVDAYIHVSIADLSLAGAGHHQAEAFWQNVSSAVGCEGGHLDCMRQVNFTSLISAANSFTTEYNYQLQPRVDGEFVSDTYEAQFYQNNFNFSGPVVVSHELHEANENAYTGVNTTADVEKYLRIFFPAISDDAASTALALYPESDYTSPGLRFADMKQHFDLTAHNLALTHAMKNQTWNAMVNISSATHGTDQSYYCEYDVHQSKGEV